MTGATSFYGSLFSESDSFILEFIRSMILLCQLEEPRVSRNSSRAGASLVRVAWRSTRIVGKRMMGRFIRFRKNPNQNKRAGYLGFKNFPWQHLQKRVEFQAIKGISCDILLL